MFRSVFILRACLVVLAPLVALTAPLLAVAGEQDHPDDTRDRVADRFPPGQEVSLFDGKQLLDWEIAAEQMFDEHGPVSVVDGTIRIESGDPASGIRWKGAFPRVHYEVTLEAKRIEGNDFFCGITFPYNDSYATLILGGWDGSATGLSNVDQLSAIENHTTTYQTYRRDQWYHIRLRVTQQAIRAWLDHQPILDLETKGHRFSIWWEQEPLRPFGIASWYTSSALRNIRLRRLPERAGQAE